MKANWIAASFFILMSLLLGAAEIKTPISGWAAVYLIIKLEDKNEIEYYEITRKFDYKDNENSFIEGMNLWVSKSKNKFWIYSIKVDENLQIIKSSSRVLDENEAFFIKDMLLALEKSSKFKIPEVPVK